LDLVGARVDRPRERELVTLDPGRVIAVQELGVRTEEVERELVQLDVELRPEHLHHARLRPRARAFGNARHGPERLPAVRLRVDPRRDQAVAPLVGDGLGVDEIVREVDQALRGGHEAAR
jgi:hypothetical protein